MNTQVQSNTRNTAAALFFVLLVAALSTQVKADGNRFNPELGQQIASQGNAALMQIRADSTHIALPVLPKLESTVTAEAPDAELSNAIAVQGNQALKTIRLQSASLSLPVLPKLEPALPVVARR